MSSFDKTSGLMYTETTSPRVRSMVATWMLQARGRRINPTEYRNGGTGCSSLQEMVLRWVIWNIDVVEIEALQFLGWHYASKLYDELRDTDTLTFNTWDVFRKAFPDEVDRHRHFNVYERETIIDQSHLYGHEVPPAQLPSIVKRLATFDMTTLTSLCIKGFDLTLDNLMSFIQIKALSSLALAPRRVFHHASVRLDEKHFRDWGRAVRETGAFTKLTLLVLSKFDIEREAILQGVSHFPALTLVGTNRWRWESKSQEETCGSWQIMSHATLSPSALVAQEQDPGKIWTDNGTTINQKVTLLYDISTKLLRNQPPDDATNLSVGITYGSNSYNIIIHDQLEWFCRDPTEETKSSTKRNDVNLSPRKGRVADANKRRRVRGTKQVDVGSLLGSFT